MKDTNEHSASARGLNLSISTKHSVEICKRLRYKTTNFAKSYLAEVMDLKRPVAFTKYKRAIGHKPGMAAGRYPQKAATQFLKLVKSAEANAQVKGLDISNLKITKILANKAAIPMTGGRSRTQTKRTHLEIFVAEGKKTGKKNPGSTKLTKAPEATVKPSVPPGSSPKQQETKQEKSAENQTEPASKSTIKSPPKPEIKSETKSEALP
jgi:large subunit ribosomal protein L22